MTRLMIYVRHHDFVNRYGIYVVTNEHGRVAFVVVTIPFLPHSYLITGFVTKVPRTAHIFRAPEARYTFRLIIFYC